MVSICFNCKRLKYPTKKKNKIYGFRCKDDSCFPTQIEEWMGCKHFKPKKRVRKDERKYKRQMKLLYGKKNGTTS